MLEVLVGEVPAGLLPAGERAERPTHLATSAEDRGACLRQCRPDLVERARDHVGPVELEDPPGACSQLSESILEREDGLLPPGKSNLLHELPREALVREEIRQGVGLGGARETPDELTVLRGRGHGAAVQRVQSLDEGALDPLVHWTPEHPPGVIGARDHGPARRRHLGEARQHGPDPFPVQRRHDGGGDLEGRDLRAVGELAGVRGVHRHRRGVLRVQRVAVVDELLVSGLQSPPVGREPFFVEGRLEVEGGADLGLHRGRSKTHVVQVQHEIGDPGGGETLAHHLEGGLLLRDEEDPLPLDHGLHDEVRDGLRLAGAGRPFDDDGPSGDGLGDDLGL